MTTTTTFDLVIVGGGNMGAALAGGLLSAGTIAGPALAICETAADRRDDLEVLVPDVATFDHVPPCTAALIAVKPADAPSAAAATAAAGAQRILSIAAGVSLATLEAALPDDIAVVRAMPNTPALVGQGMAAVAGGTAATANDLDWAESVLGAVGKVERVDESQMDAVTALTGSGPAYVFLVAEALVDAGVGVGLPRHLAESMTTQLLVGSSALLATRGDAAALRNAVTSPGGTTAAGLAVLDERDIRGILATAVEAAAARSRELGAPPTSTPM
ncbi:N/A [soil metagenome]